MTEHLQTWTPVVLERGTLALTLLPGLGGRLWDVALEGRSLLFQNPDLIGLPADLAQLRGLPSRSPQFGFPLWGGEKTWIAPDTDWPDGAPHPVLDTGPYSISRQSALSTEMTSQRCPQSRLQISRTVTIEAPSSFCIRHKVRNLGDTPRLTGLWSVMMLDHPARIAIPTANPHVRPVFGANDGMVSPQIAGVVCRCDVPREFKVGLPNPEGRTLIYSASADTWLLGLTDPPAKDDLFAHGLPFEVFNSGDYPYCEAEWHAPCKTLAPGGQHTFRQRFRIWSGETPPDDLFLTPQEQELVTCMC